MILNKNIVISLVFSLLTGGIYQASAQKPKRDFEDAKNDFEIGINPRFYINTVNLFEYSYSPYNTLRLPPVTLDFNLRLINYRHTTNYGLMYGSGLDFGTRTTKANVHYSSLGHFSAQPSSNLIKQELERTSYDTSFSFTAYAAVLRLYIGYRTTFDRNTSGNSMNLGFELGINKYFNFNGINMQLPLKARIYNPYSDLYSDVEIAEFNMAAGDFRQSPLFGLIIADLFLGIYKNVESSFMHNYYLGFTVTRVPVKTLNPEKRGLTPSEVGTIALLNYHYDPNGNRKIGSGGVSVPYEFSLGLKFGMGLWKY